MLAMAQRDLVEVAFRRGVAHQRIELVLRQHLLDGAQPVGPLGMPGRREVIEAGLMGQEKRHNGPWLIRQSRAFPKSGNRLSEEIMLKQIRAQRTDYEG